jgi:hypothetical protein
VQTASGNVVWTIPTIIATAASGLSVLAVVAGALTLAYRAGDLKRTAVEILRDLRGLALSHKFLMGAMANVGSISAKDYLEATQEFPGQLDERLVSIVGRLTPKGNPLSSEELSRFKNLWKEAFTTDPRLTAEEASEFYALSRKVAAELVRAASTRELRDPDGKRVPPEEARVNSDYLVERAAFVLGLVTSRESERRGGPTSSSETRARA